MLRKKDRVGSDLSTEHLLSFGNKIQPLSAEASASNTVPGSEQQQLQNLTSAYSNYNYKSEKVIKKKYSTNASCNSNSPVDVETNLESAGTSAASDVNTMALVKAKHDSQLSDQDNSQSSSYGTSSSNTLGVFDGHQSTSDENNSVKPLGVENQSADATLESRLGRANNSCGIDNNDIENTSVNEDLDTVVTLGAPAKEYEPKYDPYREFYFKVVDKRECEKVICNLTAEETINIDLCQRHNKTVLQQAVRNGETKMVKHLVKHHDASIQWRDEQDGSNILHYTAKLSNKHAPFVTFLMGRMDKSWLHRVNHKGYSPIIVAIEYGGVELVLEMLKWIDIGFEIDGNDKDPIDLAMNRQDGLPILKCLVEKKLVDLRKGENGNTAAHRAAFRWYVDALEIFVNADPSLSFEKAEDGATPLIKVAMNNSRNNRLRSNNSVQCADLLVSCNAKVNAIARGLKGWNSLHFAVERGNYKLLDFLLQQKHIDVDTYDDNGKTPLMYSMLQEKITIARLLLQKGKADPNLHQKGQDGKDMGNCVEIVAHLGNPTLMKLLLGQPRIEVDVKNEKGDTPMHTVIKKCSFTSCMMVTENFRQTAILLASCADEFIEIQDDLGRTPLHLAVERNGTYPIIKRMLRSCTKAQTVIDEKDEKGYTPLHTAVKMVSSSSRLALIRLLMQYGASLSVADDGKSPLHIALEQEDEEIVSILVQHKSVWELVDNDVLHDMVVNMPHLLVGGLDANIKGVHERTQFKASASDDMMLNPPEKILVNGSAIVDKMYVPKEGELTRHDSMVRPKKDPKIKEKKYHSHLRLLIHNEEVCSHPVVRAVLRSKWKMASIIYFIYLIWYAAYIWAVSGYMLSAQPPYNVTRNKTCNDNWILVNGVTLPIYIIAASLIGIGFEILQVIHAGIDEVLTLLNITDWMTFISAIIMVIDIDGCLVHVHEQYVLGVFCVFLAWINLLFYLRKLPEVGIYVVMIGMVLRTFFKFFLVFFLFILAFAYCFTLMLGNQWPFQNFGYSIIKTWVMMVGELEFVTIFHGYYTEPSPETRLHFESPTYVLFCAFLVIMSLIIMNLLTGLAVSDVSLLQDDSLKYMRIMTTNISLDVEQAMPQWLQMKLYKSDLQFHVARDTNRVFTFLDNLYFGALSIESIKNDSMAIIKRHKKSNAEFAAKAEESRAEQIGELKSKVDELDHKIGAAVSEIRDVTMNVNAHLAAHSRS